MQLRMERCGYCGQPVSRANCCSRRSLRVSKREQFSKTGSFHKGGPCDALLGSGLSLRLHGDIDRSEYKEDAGDPFVVIGTLGLGVPFKGDIGIYTGLKGYIGRYRDI